MLFNTGQRWRCGPKRKQECAMTNVSNTKILSLKTNLTALALILSTSAQLAAADLGQRADYRYNAPSYYSPQPVSSWGGFYGGIMASPGIARLNHGQNSTFGQLAGGSIGLAAGYQFQSNQLVLGAEANYFWSNISHFQSLNYSIISHAQLDGLGFIRGRVGYAMDRLLIYGHIGYAGGNLKASLYDAGQPAWAGGPYYTEDRWRNGIAAGVGLEFAINDHVSARAEYIYANLRPRSIFTGAHAGTTGADLSLLNMGLFYRF